MGRKPSAAEPETCPYTDEEYEAAKKMSQSLGFYYLDKLPTLKALSKGLKPGMTEAEVTEKVGNPIGIYYLKLVEPSIMDMFVEHMGVFETELFKTFSPQGFYLPVEGGEGDFLMVYRLAPERLPIVEEGKSRPVGFAVFFRENKVESWKLFESSVIRERKIVGQKSTLRMVLPEMNMRDENFDVITYLEAIQIPDLENQKATKHDLLHLFSWAT